MAWTRNRLLFAFSLIAFATPNPLGNPIKAATNSVGEKGAQIYCFMRISGNDHEVSWNAAYEVIKRQKSSLFKTSPKHGAVMIVETVVRQPEKYEDCGIYLGDLYRTPTINSSSKINSDEEEGETPRSKGEKQDRYSY